MKKVFLVEKKIDKNYFEKSLHCEGGGMGGLRPIWKKFTFLISFVMATLLLSAFIII